MAKCKDCGTELYERGSEQNAGSGDGKHFLNECRDTLLKRVGRLTQAIQSFRNLPMLGKMTRLRSTQEYAELCLAWEESTDFKREEE